MLEDFRERALFTQLLQGLVRYDRLLEEEIKRRLLRNKKLQKSVSAILKLGIFELLFMEKIPARASLHQAGWLAERFRVKAAKPLINGILRKLLEELDQGYDPKMTHSFEIYQSFPSWMLERWKSQYGEHQALELCQFSNQFQGVHLLLHDPEKQNLVLNEFSDLSFAYEPHDVIPRMFVLHDGKGFMKTKAFQKGWISVIDPASVLFMLWAAPFFQGKVMDVCAAPGSKSLYLLEMVDGKGNIFCSDIDEARVRIGKKRTEKLNLPIKWNRKDASSDQFPLADFILIDAPCSGSGVIRRRPDIRWNRTKKDIRLMSVRQLKILNNMSKYLKVNGVIVYSTCSINHEENWDVVSSFLNLKKEFHLEPAQNFVPNEWINHNQCLETFPSKDNVDGMFAARLRKVC